MSITDSDNHGSTKPELLPLNYVGPMFGFSAKSTKHFLQNVATRELHLTPVKRGNRWFFNSSEVVRAIEALANMTAARRKAEESFPQEPTQNVRCFSANEVAIRSGYSPGYFRRVVAPRLGLRAVKVGRSYYFVAASVEAIVEGREAMAVRLSASPNAKIPDTAESLAPALRPTA